MTECYLFGDFIRDCNQIRLETKHNAHNSVQKRKQASRPNSANVQSPPSSNSKQMIIDPKENNLQDDIMTSAKLVFSSIDFGTADEVPPSKRQRKPVEQLLREV